jgi:hypothetical protein
MSPQRFPLGREKNKVSMSRGEAQIICKALCARLTSPGDPVVLWAEEAPAHVVSGTMPAPVYRVRLLDTGNRLPLWVNSADEAHQWLRKRDRA